MLLVLSLLLACGDPDDGRGSGDASDSGDTDGGGTDGGGTDGGGTDEGGSDSGSSDGGGTDSGGTDSGGTDSGGTDSGGTDSGGTDSGGETLPEGCPEPTETGPEIPPPQPRLLSPSDGSTVADPTPTLTVQPCPDPDGGDFIVTFSIADAGDVEVEHSDLLPGTLDELSWTGTVPLDPGAQYCWAAWSTDEDGNHSTIEEVACFTVE